MRECCTKILKPIFRKHLIRRWENSKLIQWEMVQRIMMASLSFLPELHYAFEKDDPKAA